MCSKIYAAFFIIVAILLAVLANVLPPEKIDYIITLSKIFDVMIPVLAVGALIKYISKGVCGAMWGCKSGKCGCDCHGCTCCATKGTDKLN